MIDTPNVPEPVWQLMQQKLGCDDAQMAEFKQVPRNQRAAATAMTMVNKIIVFEVVESHGCFNDHETGHRLFFGGDATLLTEPAPPRICAHLLSQIGPLVFTIQELTYAGVDPNVLCFNRAACIDVGRECGGWGRVVVEAKVLDRADAEPLMLG